MGRQDRTFVYVLQDKQSGNYEVLADKPALDAFFAKYDRRHYFLSREPVVTVEAIRAEDEFFDQLASILE